MHFFFLSWGIIWRFLASPKEKYGHILHLIIDFLFVLQKKNTEAESPCSRSLTEELTFYVLDGTWNTRSKHSLSLTRSLGLSRRVVIDTEWKNKIDERSSSSHMHGTFISAYDWLHDNVGRKSYEHGDNDDANYPATELHAMQLIQWTGKECP